MPKTDFGCGPYLCDDPSSVPFWAVIILLILLVLLIVSFVQTKKDPPTLEKAVDDVLKGFEDQAQTWGNIEAKDAFSQARTKVRNEIVKYKSTFI